MADVPGRRSGTLVIEGGTFKTASGSAVIKNEPTGVLTIYEVKDNGDGTWTVSKK